MDGSHFSQIEIAQGRRVAHLREALGSQIVGLLADEEVTDIYLDPADALGEHGKLWVVRHGEPPTTIGTIDSARAHALISAVAGTLGTVINREKQIVEGELFGNGPRFEGLIPPAVLTPAFAIRRPTSKRFTLADYVAAGAMTTRQSKRLEEAILRRENMIVVGGTGSGKTTLLNALADGVARLTPYHRVVTIEGARELRVPCASKVSIRTSEQLDEKAALRAALRLNPDRIWVGEVRGPEALDMLRCWNTGHDGGLCSLHSNISTPSDALLRLEQMCSLATEAPVQRQIAGTINLIVCLRRYPDGKRRIEQMVSVQGWAGTDYRLNVEN